jgi:hypothetical protein
MNLFVCVKVEEVGGYEPLCATAVALTEEEAVRKLLEFADEKPETFTDATLKDPFGRGIVRRQLPLLRRSP